MHSCIFIIAVLLIVSGNVELNPGPMKKCPKCEKMMPTRSNNCRCGHLLCYVAARVLHFSAFIIFYYLLVDVFIIIYYLLVDGLLLFIIYFWMVYYYLLFTFGCVFYHYLLFTCRCVFCYYMYFNLIFFI